MKSSEADLFLENMGTEQTASTANITEDEEDELCKVYPTNTYSGEAQQVDKNKFTFSCDKQSISDMCLAVAQANLVHQTQQDIMRMFSLDFCEQSENKEVEQKCEDAKELVSIKEPYTPVTGILF